MDVSPQGTLIVSGGCDTTARVWDTRNGKCVHVFTGHLNDINTVQYVGHRGRGVSVG